MKAFSSSTHKVQPAPASKIPLGKEQQFLAGFEIYDTDARVFPSVQVDGQHAHFVDVLTGPF